MGDLIRLLTRADAGRRRWREPWSAAAAPEGWTTAELFFDLRCPFSYLAAEQLERAFDELAWRPASLTAMRGVGAGVPAGGGAGVPAGGGAGLRAGGTAAYRRRAEARADALRLPLVWPERWPADVPAAMRVSAHAAQRGRGGPFVLAAMRLAFCGGFHLDDPETLAEAAAAAALPLDDCFAAARDARRDRAIARTGRRLAAAGVDELPAVRVDGELHWGEADVASLVEITRLERAARV